MAFKKKHRKLIEQAVKEMPIVTTLTQEKHFVKGEELIAQGHDDVDPNKTYEQNMPVVIARNHLNRMKRAFTNDKQNGMKNYIASVTQIVKANV